MNNVVLKTVLAIGGMTWVFILLTSGVVHVDTAVQGEGTVHEYRALWAPFGGAATAAGLFVWLFDKWLWAWVPFRWFAKRPDLRGTWRGELQSQWLDPQSQATRPPIPAFVSVKQSASTLYLRQFTADSESATIAATILLDPDDTESVAILYRNDPKIAVRDRSPIHFGGMHLRVSGDGALEGDYWTDRNTNGRLTLKRVSCKTSRSFAEAAQVAAKAKA